MLHSSQSGFSLQVDNLPSTQSSICLSLTTLSLSSVVCAVSEELREREERGEAERSPLQPEIQHRGMDSRDNPQPPPHPPLPNMIVGHAPYGPTPTASHMVINHHNGTNTVAGNPNSTATAMMHHHNHHGHHQQQHHQHQQQQQQPHPHHHHQQPQQHQQQQQQQPRFSFVGPPSSEPLDSLAAATGLYDGPAPSGFSIEPAKKKRGRPRKYAPEGNIALGLGPASTPPSSGAAPGSPSTDPPAKKNRGRPPGSGKKQMDALGAGGIGFTPHVILVKSGEDIASKIVAFSQEGPRTICILSAVGVVCNVTLRQPSMPGPPATYEGRYEIISLTGSFQFPEGESNYNRISGLSVSLAGADGRVIGGSVAGMLIAAGPVQVVVGSFLANKKKASSNSMKSGPSSAPQSQTLNFGGPQATVTPPSHDGSSESSDENGNGGSPMGRPSGYYNADVSQPMHGMQMYHHLWAGQAGHR